MNELKYKLILKSNFLTSQNGVIGKDIDSTYKRDYSGKPIIYGKHIKGIVKERILQFERALEIEKTASNQLGREGNNISKIFFSNLKLDNTDFRSSYRTSVAIDRGNRTSIDNSLFDYEFLESNQNFEGSIKFNKELPKEDIKLILAAMFHIDRIGGFKSRGLGDVSVKFLLDGEYVGIEKLDNLVDSIKFNKINVECKEYKEYEINVEFLSPLVLQSRKITNIVETRLDLQGSTIRGALIQLGLDKGIDIKNLLGIKVKLFNNNIKLFSEFETKYKLEKTKKKKYIDKSIDDLTTEEFENGVSNKYQDSSINDFEELVDDISISIETGSKTSKDGHLFNNEIIEHVDNMPEYKGKIYIPESLASKDLELFVGKYKSKGFGRIKLTLSDVKKDCDIKKLKDKIEKYNKKINDSKVYVTFDLLSDCILPETRLYNALEQFKNLLKIEELTPESNRCFIKSSLLSGYNIINNIRKADEIVLKKGSVLTFSTTDLDSILPKLFNIEQNGVGVRKNEGFGIVNICTDTKVRGGKND